MERKRSRNLNCGLICWQIGALTKGTDTGVHSMRSRRMCMQRRSTTLHTPQKNRFVQHMNKICVFRAGWCFSCFLFPFTLNTLQRIITAAHNFHYSGFQITVKFLVFSTHTCPNAHNHSCTVQIFGRFVSFRLPSFCFLSDDDKKTLGKKHCIFRCKFTDA